MPFEAVPFDFQSRFVRVLRDERGEPWFNANDVCSILGYKNPWDALATHVDDDDLAKREVIDSMGRKQQANFINEAGLYALIFGSEKPEAKAFKRWVTHEVLPSIRKTGYYGFPQHEAKRIEETAKLVRSLRRYYGAFGLSGSERLAAIQSALDGYGLGALPPMEAFMDRLVSPTQLGVSLGKSVHEVNQLLRDLGLQEQIEGQWIATAKGKPFCERRAVSKSGHGKRALRWHEQQTLSLIREAHCQQQQHVVAAISVLNRHHP